MDPLVFYQKKEGMGLIRYLQGKLSRKKWEKKGWTWGFEHLDEPIVPTIVFWNNWLPDVTCSVRKDRPNIIKCEGKSPDVYNLVSELVRGYKESTLIEIVG